MGNLKVADTKVRWTSAKAEQMVAAGVAQGFGKANDRNGVAQAVPLWATPAMRAIERAGQYALSSQMVFVKNKTAQDPADLEIFKNLGEGKNRLRPEELIMVQRSFVSVVDDDESVRESLPDLLKEFGFAVQTFSSAEEFLNSCFVAKTECLILDISMPGMSGPELQQELALRHRKIPIIFITAQRDEAIRPKVLKLGAVECLTKPFSDTALLEALNIAFQVK